MIVASTCELDTFLIVSTPESVTVDSVPRIVLDLELPANASVDLTSVLLNTITDCPITNYRIANVSVGESNLT